MLHFYQKFLEDSPQIRSLYLRQLENCSSVRRFEEKSGAVWLGVGLHASTIVSHQVSPHAEWVGGNGKTVRLTADITDAIDLK